MFLSHSLLISQVLQLLAPPILQSVFLARSIGTPQQGDNILRNKAMFLLQGRHHFLQRYAIL